MASPTDWGRGGATGFTRDPQNEQTIPLAANAAFTGGWTRIDKTASFLLLYGTHVPFTMQIQWSKDGVTRDLDPFATITPQVRSALGLYSVISPQSTFFRPYYRIVVTNGPSPQLFVVSDAILLNTIFPGYQISVDGPIPVLGLANLNHGLAWGKGPSGWLPQKLTAAGNQAVALAENLAGPLPVTVGNFPAAPAVQPVSATALPLPADASTEATLAAVLAKLNVGLSVVSTPVTWQKLHSIGTGLAVQVKVGPGVLRGVVLKGGATFTAYDGIAGTTGKFLDISGTQEFTGPIDVGFTLGLRIIVQATKLYTVIYS